VPPSRAREITQGLWRRGTRVVHLSQLADTEAGERLHCVHVARGELRGWAGAPVVMHCMRLWDAAVRPSP